MTIREIKKINKHIQKLNSKAERLRSDACKVTSSISQTPSSGGEQDKIGAAVAGLADIQTEIEHLVSYRDSELNRLSHNVFEENCIFLHLVRGHTWRYIASIVDGRPDTADSIRMKCHRYIW